jgi:hypothetical protein
MYLHNAGTQDFAPPPTPLAVAPVTTLGFCKHYPFVVCVFYGQQIGGDFPETLRTSDLVMAARNWIKSHHH